MLYAFIDERFDFPATSEGRTIAIACIAVPQSGYSDRIDRFATIRRRDRAGLVSALNEALTAVHGYAVIGTATLDASLLRYGEIDASLDLPSGVARTDNVWSAAMIFTVGRALASMRLRSGPFSTVDLHLDPRSLTPQHQRAIHATLQKELPAIHREWCDAHQLIHGRKISIRRQGFVRKPKPGQAISKFQIGTALADALLRCPSQSTKEWSRIEWVSLTDLITDHLQRWDRLADEAPA
jgi:hypothetical protein